VSDLVFFNARKLQTKTKPVGPVAFISSFYKEAGFGDYHNSPLWQLRRDLHRLNVSDEFGLYREQHSNQEIVWVAEWSERNLADKQPLVVVDRLVEVLAQSELYICVLADARSGPKDHGSPVNIADRAAATSYLEIELYAAAMYAKPIRLFVLDGFSPGPRLELLLHLLSFVLPDWREKKALPASAIENEVRQEIDRHLHRKNARVVPLRKRLVRDFYLARGKKGTPGHEINNVLFLDGEFENRPLPQKDLVEDLLADFDRVPEMQRKLSRMWLAARELMSASYMPKDVQADSRLADFLPLWSKVLGLWAGAAAWSGLHGHIYAGTVAPLNSQAVIQAQMSAGKPPNGPLASAYYSIANLMPVGLRRLECLWRASRYIEDEIYRAGNQNPNVLAIRGSIRLRLGNVWGGVSDFKRMLQIRQRVALSEAEIGDAMVHLGFAYLHCGRWLKARDLLERGVRAMSMKQNHPGLARAKRKLALGYKLTGRFADAKQCLREAEADALRLGALDQIRGR
jgi:tetratricopeptide (TPR) repeat protein